MKRIFFTFLLCIAFVGGLGVFANTVCKASSHELTGQDIAAMRLINLKACDKGNALACHELSVNDIVLCILSSSAKEQTAYYEEATFALERACHLGNSNSCKIAFGRK